MSPICYCSVLLLLLLLPREVQGGNILVFPSEGSHWINMDILLKALHSRGHNITVVRCSKSWYIKENSYYSTITVPVESGLNQDFANVFLDDFMKYQRGDVPLTTFLYTVVRVLPKVAEVHNNVSELVSVMLDDTHMIRRIKESKFDLVLSDPCWGNGVIMAKYFNLPLVYNVRWLMPEEAHFAIAPSPLSYVPVTGSGLTDKITFIQRVKNILVYQFTQLQSIFPSKLVYQPLCDKYLGPDTDFDQIKIDADIWLMRTDFVFDYPRPTMPNVVYMGGFHCKPPEPLPEDLEEFVQSSGEHGVIIMSLGAFVSKLPDDFANEIAVAFAKLPQKVIWTHKGKSPDTLGNNTLMVDWMPQKDLLGHPKIKLFVAHGGTNGVQEAMCHAVPVVGLPLFFDQYDNLLRLQEKGAAKVLDPVTLDKDILLKALREVLNEPSYRMNMQKLSELYHDRPMKPMDTAVFWIEFVMRHKGAAHLKAQSFKMSWYIYHSVDVVLFLTAVLLLMILTTVLFFKCLCNSLRKKKIKDD